MRAIVLALLVISASVSAADRILLFGGSAVVDTRIAPLMADGFDETCNFLYNHVTLQYGHLTDGLGYSANTWVKSGGTGLRWEGAWLLAQIQANRLYAASANPCGYGASANQAVTPYVNLSSVPSAVRVSMFSVSGKEPILYWRHDGGTNYIYASAQIQAFNGWICRYTKFLGSSTELLAVNIGDAYANQPVTILEVGDTHYFWQGSKLVGTPMTISDAALKTGQRVQMYLWSATSGLGCSVDYVSAWPSTMTLSACTNAFTLQPPP